MGGEDDLVGAECSQGVLHRLQRIAVADLASRLDACFREPRQAGIEPLLRRGPRTVVVGDPVLQRRVERRRDHEDLLADVEASLQDHRAQSVAADGLVRDDEDPALTLGVGPRRRSLRPLLAARVRPPCHRDGAQEEEDAEPDPLAPGDGGDHDRCEVTDRRDQELERLGLTSERVDHRVR
jgi:hypothetical protein